MLRAVVAAAWLLLGVLTTTAHAETLTADPVLRDRLARSLAADIDSGDRFDAEVWLFASEQRLQRYLNDHRERLELLKLVYREASRQDLDPDLVMAVIQVESAFDRYAISRVGAQGLMQVMPFWRIEIGRPQDNLTDPATNVRYGTTILAHYLEQASGDLVDALARYNGSRGKLRYPERVVEAWRTRWRNKTNDDLPQLQAGCRAYGLRACNYR
ncbi:MAG: transglycosylase SLT domain-containing protein [Pseudomonadales bacterium]